MEHLVQFTFNFDDDAIQRKIEERAYKDVVEKMYDQAIQKVPRNYYGIDWKAMVYENVQAFMENNRDEIIKAAAGQLADKLRRPKAVREAAENVAREEG